MKYIICKIFLNFQINRYFKLITLLITNLKFIKNFVRMSIKLNRIAMKHFLIFTLLTIFANSLFGQASYVTDEIIKNIINKKGGIKKIRTIKEYAFVKKGYILIRADAYDTFGRLVNLSAFKGNDQHHITEKSLIKYYVNSDTIFVQIDTLYRGYSDYFRRGAVSISKSEEGYLDNGIDSFQVITTVLMKIKNDYLRKLYRFDGLLFETEAAAIWQFPPALEFDDNGMVFCNNIDSTYCLSKKSTDSIGTKYYYASTFKNIPENKASIVSYENNRIVQLDDSFFGRVWVCVYSKDENYADISCLDTSGRLLFFLTRIANGSTINTTFFPTNGSMIVHKNYKSGKIISMESRYLNAVSKNLFESVEYHYSKNGKLKSLVSTKVDFYINLKTVTKFTYW
jgi:hypothetical protein